MRSGRHGSRVIAMQSGRARIPISRYFTATRSLSDCIRRRTHKRVLQRRRHKDFWALSNVEYHQRQLVDCSDPTYTQLSEEIRKSLQRKLGDCSDPAYAQLSEEIRKSLQR